MTTFYMYKVNVIQQCKFMIILKSEYIELFGKTLLK